MASLACILPFGAGRESAKICEVLLKFAEGLKPFYIASAYDALAHAEMVAENRAKMQEYLEKTFAHAEKIEDEEDKQVWMEDLGTIR